MAFKTIHKSISREDRTFAPYFRIIRATQFAKAFKMD